MIRIEYSEIERRDRVLRKELLRMLHSVWFVLGICFTLALCFFSEIVAGEESYTILQVLKNMSRAAMAREPQLMPAVALRNAFSGYVSLFVPIISALPMTQLLHIETQSGYKRFYMSRKSHREYYWCKWSAGMLSGALMLLIVAVLFHGFMVLFLPGTDAETLEMFGYADGNRVWDLVRTYIGILAYGAFSVIPAIFIASFTNNFYFVLCLPFMFSYFWDVAVSAAAKFIRTHQAGEIFPNIIELFFSRANLGIAESGRNFLVQAGRAAVLLTAVFLVYCFYLSRRKDCGE